MKKKLLLAGACLGCVGSVLVLIRTIMAASFPEWLRWIGAACLLLGIVANLTFLRDIGRKSDDQPR